MSGPRLLADENIPRSVVSALRSRGFDIVSVQEIRPGMSDEEVVELAKRELRVIITFDKDFGRIALLEPGVPGLVLLRIPPRDPNYIAQRILSALERVGDPRGKFIIVRKRTVKIIRLR